LLATKQEETGTPLSAVGFPDAECKLEVKKWDSIDPSSGWAPKGLGQRGISRDPLHPQQPKIRALGRDLLPGRCRGLL